MKVAVVQMNARDNKSKNIKRALALIRQAIENKAKFIVLPEVFIFRGKPKGKNSIFTNAESTLGPTTLLLASVAQKRRVFILAGSLYEKIIRKDKVYNTSVLINDEGRIVAAYRKIHLFDAVVGKKIVRESRVFKPGKKPAICCVGEFKVGLSICYDLRFPDLYRNYAKKGSEILCVPSSFTKETGRAHWEALLRARAIENLCYVLAPNQIGKNYEGIMSYGNSMIVDPWGKIIARASGHKEEILYAEINKKDLVGARRKLPAVTK